METQPSKEEDKGKTIIIPNKSAMHALVDFATAKKPKGWARKSYATYYKRAYAEWIQKDIDAMLVDRKPRLYDKKKFPNISLHSLYLRINQSLMYLIAPENGMDSEKIYFNWRETVSIKKIEGCGIRISFDPVVEGGETADIVEDDDMTPTWKKDLMEWLEGQDTAPFVKSGLALSDAQIQLLEEELDGLTTVIHNITNRSVKVIKVA